MYVYSPYLNDEELNAIGITKIDDVQAAVTTLLADHKTVAVSSEGPYVVGLLDQTKIAARRAVAAAGMDAAQM